MGVVCSIVFFATDLPSTNNSPVPLFPKPGPSYLKSNRRVCLPGPSSGPSQTVPLKIEQIIEEHRPSVADSLEAFAQKQAIAAESPPFGDDHAFCAAFRDLKFRLDGKVFGQDVWGAGGRYARQLTRVLEFHSAGGCARARVSRKRESVELSNGKTSYFAAST